MPGANYYYYPISAAAHLSSQLGPTMDGRTSISSSSQTHSSLSRARLSSLRGLLTKSPLEGALWGAICAELSGANRKDGSSGARERLIIAQLGHVNNFGVSARHGACSSSEPHSKPLFSTDRRPAGENTREAAKLGLNEQSGQHQHQHSTSVSIIRPSETNRQRLIDSGHHSSLIGAS